MDLYNEINELLTAQFPEHREDYRINLITDLLINKVRTVATDFGRYARDESSDNLSELYNQYLENY